MRHALHGWVWPAPCAGGRGNSPCFARDEMCALHPQALERRETHHPVEHSSLVGARGEQVHLGGYEDHWISPDEIPDAGQEIPRRVQHVHQQDGHGALLPHMRERPAEPLGRRQADLHACGFKKAGDRRAAAASAPRCLRVPPPTSPGSLRRARSWTPGTIFPWLRSWHLSQSRRSS